MLRTPVRWRAALVAVLASLAAFAQNPLWRPKVLPPFPLTGFYDAPKPLPPGTPGQLIRSEAFDDYDLPFVKATRILYHSRSASGEDVPVSGVVLTPAGNPPSGGWPVIAYAHPFSGAARTCGPTLARNLDYGPTFALWTGQHYAVVATDYAGLGSAVRNAVMDMQSNANDVVSAVRAAHAAVPGLGAKWVALGDSEGAPAIIALSETESDPNFLGGVALSGVTDLKDVYQRLAKGNSRGRLALLAYAVKTTSPAFDPAGMLTKKGMLLYDQVARNCAAPADSPEDLLKTGWEDQPAVQAFFERNRVGTRRAAVPLLVISGDSDPIFPVDSVNAAVDRMCKEGDRVQFDRYSRLDRLRVPGESITAQTSWIRERYAGKNAPSNCP